MKGLYNQLDTSGKHRRELTLLGPSWGRSLLLPVGGDRVCKPLDRCCCVGSGIAEVEATGLAVIGSPNESVLGVIRGGIAVYLL